MNHASLSISLGVDVAACFEGAAVVDQYRLAFDYPAMSEPVCYANLVPDPQTRAEGALFALPPETLDALDTREGVTRGRYRRVWISVQVGDGPATLALSYVGNLTLPYEAAPSDRYAGLLIQGSHDSLVTQGYRDWLVSHMATLPVRPGPEND